MSNKFPIYLAKIEISPNGFRQFIKSETPYTEIIWGSNYDKFMFKLRRAYFPKPNCNFNCPHGREFFCCNGCRSHYGYFEWRETGYFSKEDKNKILSSWDNDTGFNRKEGCVLPREIRSLVCLSFECRHSKTKE